MQLEEMEANAGRAVTLLKALANERRLFILCQLLERELSVGELNEVLGLSQSALSQHLAVLRGAKLVREERQGRFVNYEVDPDGLALIAGWLAKYRAYGPARVDALKALLKDMDQ